MSAMSSTSCSPPTFSDSLPTEVLLQLSPSCHQSSLPLLLSVLLSSIRDIGSLLRTASLSSNSVGTSNAFGDLQLDVDVKTNAALFDRLKASGLVAVASSEEEPVEVPCGGSSFSVAFDPLDGSSVFDCNFAVGTIVGVWPGIGLQGRRGREQVASLFSVYGPFVTVALAFSGEQTVSGSPLAVDLTMHPDCWVSASKPFVIGPKTKTFAPDNLRATSTNLKYKSIVDFWINSNYTLRYSGALVPDVYHILRKGHGVFVNASSRESKAKLRLLFEAAPLALIVEAAGGNAIACPTEDDEQWGGAPLLDIVADNMDKRVGVAYGSQEEVARIKAVLFDN